jgi:hypothetical protein
VLSSPISNPCFVASHALAPKEKAPTESGL